MLPFRDVIPSRTAPVVTVGLIVVHLAAFLTVPAEAEWWTPVASLFGHGGWIQLVVNLWALWLFGDSVEDRLGHWRFLILYLVAAAAAALVHAWAAPHLSLAVISPAPNAAGAVAGIIGGHFLLYPRSRMLVFVPRFTSIDLVEIPSVGCAGLWLATQMFLSLGHIGDPAAAGGLSLVTDAGGIAAGVGLVWLFSHSRREKRWWYQ